MSLKFGYPTLVSKSDFKLGIATVISKIQLLYQNLEFSIGIPTLNPEL